jgi:hypothetical protein
MSEVPFFKTLYNETGPVGNFGRGTHYSVMRVPIWQDTLLRPMHQGAMLDFAIIWDEDHDERVLEVIERMYFAGLLAPVRFIGERKGTLSVLIDAGAVEAWKPAALKKYRDAVVSISNNQNDPWPAHVSSLASLAGSPAPAIGLDPSIIHENRAKVIAYLQNIDMLWNVGIKPHELQIDLPNNGAEEYLEGGSTQTKATNTTNTTTDDSDPVDIPF